MKIEFAASPGDIKPSDGLQVMLPRQDKPYPKSHLAACEKAAKQTGVPVCTAPFENGEHISMAYIGQEGIFVQNACFLPGGLGKYKTGFDVEVFETTFGKVALACGLDILQPQYARAAAFKGCRLMVCGLWLPGRKYMMAGPWSNAQANCMAVVAAQPGKGRLVLPCKLTKDMSGLGSVSFEQGMLEEAYKDFPVFDCMDPGLYQRYGEELI